MAKNGIVPYSNIQECFGYVKVKYIKEVASGSFELPTELMFASDDGKGNDMRINVINAIKKVTYHDMEDAINADEVNVPENEADVLETIVQLACS